MKRRFHFSLPVSVVIVAITYIHISTVFIFLDRWFGLISSLGVMNALLFSVLASMYVFAAIFTDPGRVPSTYMPDVEVPKRPILEIKHKGGQTLHTILSHANNEARDPNNPSN